jgi:hypothetical protein
VKETRDILIVGAGPAGLFAANELTDKGLEVLVIDQGKAIEERYCPLEEKSKCLRCEPCNIMAGVGGAGTFSDGTLNLRPDIGGNLSALTHDPSKAWELVDRVDKIFLRHEVPNEMRKPSTKEIDLLKRKAASVGAKFIDIPQRHIGSDRTKKVIKSLVTDLKEKGIDFLLNTKVEDLLIVDNECKGVITQKEELEASRVIMAPGRIGTEWMEQIIDKYKLDAEYGPIDVGVRVEVPAIVMDPITRINRDPKFHIHTKHYDDFVRTFCTNENGFVVKEEYPGFICTNGHSMKERSSSNTNFAFLVRIELTEPVENTTKYGRSIAKLATTIGGGKPILQRMGDLRRGRRSNAPRIKKNIVEPTLKEYTPGDISMAMPHRIVMDLVEGLEALNQIMPGVASDSTLLYAPEIKFYAMEVKVNEWLETSIKNLYAAGDGTGLSRDIVNAASTGIIAGEGVLQGLKK